MKDIFAFFGFMVIIILIIFSLALIWEGVTYAISTAIHRYKYKHRFDKKPIAKCYCVDCVNFDPSSMRCSYRQHFTHDSGFCSYAEPRKKEEL